MKTQKSKLTQNTGSFINHLYSNNSTLPVVGELATILLYSDRHVVKVVEVSQCGRIVTLETMHTKADLSVQCGEGHQNWIHEPSGYTYTIHWRKNAWKRKHVEYFFTKEFRDSIPCDCIGIWLSKNNKKLFDKIYNGHVMPQVEVDGITKAKNSYSVIKIIFGVNDYYYDWTI